MSHSKFILSPLSKILIDISLASQGAGAGIETFPLCDYVMQSVFLRLTGAQEQKMKCIFWEIASYDYEYRQSKLRQGIAGEFSSYKDKEGIYRDLTSQIEVLTPGPLPPNPVDCNKVLQDTKQVIENAFNGTNLHSWAQKSFTEFKILQSQIDVLHFADGRNLLIADNNVTPEKRLPFNKCLKEVYVDHLYVHRNRVAHNTLSYQQNLPTLSKLKAGEYVYENYFLYFFLLILIDNIVIDLFSKYLEVRDTALRY